MRNYCKIAFTLIFIILTAPIVQRQTSACLDRFHKKLKNCGPRNCNQKLWKSVCWQYCTVGRLILVISSVSQPEIHPHHSWFQNYPDSNSKPSPAFSYVSPQFCRHLSYFLAIVSTLCSATIAVFITFRTRVRRICRCLERTGPSETHRWSAVPMPLWSPPLARRSSCKAESLSCNSAGTGRSFIYR